MRPIDQVLARLESYVAQRSLQEAGAYIDESLGHLEDLASVLNIRGLAAFAAGDWATALAAFRAAAALRPKEAALHYNVADTCLRLKDYLGAANSCREALKIDPSAGRAAQVLSAFEKNLGKERDTLYAFYDFAVSPVTFDFVTFLALAEVERRRSGADVLRVIFVPGDQDGFRQATDRDRAFSRARKEWRVHNIQLPACRLVRACSGAVLCVTRQEALAYERKAGDRIFPQGYGVLHPKHEYDMARLLQVASAGADVRILESPPQAIAHVSEWLDRHAGGRAAVSITIRQSDFQAARNSDATSWARFAKWLGEQNFLPVIVPDTEAYLSGVSVRLGAGIEYPAAAVNIELRAALYERCLINLMVGGGPHVICNSGAKMRYIAFILTTDNGVASTPKWFADQGLPPGTQPSFAGKFQRYAWSGDGFDSIVKEFEAMLSQMNEAGIVPS